MENSLLTSDHFVDQDGLGSGWYDPTKPEVSIVVLNLNRSDLTQECLRQIWAHTQGRRYEIIVVDNGSTDHEFHKLANFAGQFRLLRLPHNRFYGEGNNIGVEASRGRYIVFLHNDAFVATKWLEPLVAVFDNEVNAGGIGAKLMFPDGRLQEAGAFIDDQAIAVQCGRFYSLEASEITRITIVDYCSTACFLTSREVFDRVSGFDPTFEPAYYEDADLCFKIACLGRVIYYCPHSEAYHIGSATSSEPAENNRRKFLARWGGYLSSRENNSSLPPLPPARHRNGQFARSNQPVAVFYTPYELVPGGGERYLLTAAAALRDTHRVFVATEARYSSYRLDYMERELSLDLSGVSILPRTELRHCGRIDLFVSMGNYALPLTPAYGRKNLFMCQFPFPMTEAEVGQYWENLRSYDEVIVNSLFTRDCLYTRISPFQFHAPITVLAPPVQAGLNQNSSKPAGRPIILSIGRFYAGGHNKRHDILLEGLQQLLEEGSECELHLVGTLHANQLRHYSELLRKGERLPVSFHPNASPDVVQNLLSRATIYWHATGFEICPMVSPEKCEHFGISIVEAMAAGCVPFVVANGGPPEFVREDETGFQYSTVSELVAKTRALLDAPGRAAIISEAAVREAQCFSEEVFIEKWRKIAGVSQRLATPPAADAVEQSGPAHSSRSYRSHKRCT